MCIKYSLLHILSYNITYFLAVLFFIPHFAQVNFGLPCHDFMRGCEWVNANPLGGSDFGCGPLDIYARPVGLATTSFDLHLQFAGGNH